MKLRDIVLHVCFNSRHREVYMDTFLKNKAKDGAVILKRSRAMVIIGEEEHIFKTEQEICEYHLNGVQYNRVEGFVPTHLEKYINSRIVR